MERLEDFRRVFAEVVVARAGTRDPRLRDAFGSVRREKFMEPGPWVFGEHGMVSHSDDPALLYQDVALGLFPEERLTTGLPSLHAECLASCDIATGDHVVHVGAGAGYFTAIIAELVGPRGSVRAYELNATLARRAKQNLADRANVEVLAESGALASFDTANVAYVCAAVQEPPLTWFESLRPGARLLFPLTPQSEQGAVLLVRRTTDGRAFDARFVCRARFVPCIGTQGEGASEKLRVAFADNSYTAVRSLVLGAHEADPSTWFAGQGWALSTRANEG